MAAGNAAAVAVLIMLASFKAAGLRVGLVDGRRLAADRPIAVNTDLRTAECSATPHR